MAESASWPGLLRTLVAGADLDPDDARWAMTEILQGRAAEAQVAAFATALRAKGETPAEVGALVEVMLAHAQRVPLPEGLVVLDVVGTGGDGSHSVNLSTMAALVAAACGAPVAKHGNRAATSATGTADVLEALGAIIDLPPAQVAECIEQSGMGFCFAPVFHPAMRFAAPARKAIGIPTVFNILGPLTNPAGARAALIGCADAALAPVMAQVLGARGVTALIVRGDDGLDEISIHAPTRVWDTAGGTAVIDPRALGIAEHDAGLLRGGDAQRNADLLRRALDPRAGGAELDAIRDAVALNAAAALAVYTACAAEPRSIAEGMTELIGVHLPAARDAVNSGDAAGVLDRFIAATRQLRPAG